MARSRKARATEIVRILRQSYSSFKKGKSDGLTEIILLSAIGEGRGEKHAAAALAAIREAFTDYNEVRVSSAMELAPILQEAGIVRSVDRARALKSTIEEIYQKYNALGIDSEQAVDVKHREKAVRRLRSADAAAVEAGLLFGFDAPVITLSQAVQRVTKRLGILESTTQGRMLKQIAPDVNAAGLPDILHCYAVVAAEHCFQKDMDCDSCPLLKLCDTGPKELDKRERARIAAEKKRLAEEEKERKLAERRRKRMKDAVSRRLKAAALEIAAESERKAAIENKRADKARAIKEAKAAKVKAQKAKVAKAKAEKAKAAKAKAAKAKAEKAKAAKAKAAKVKAAKAKAVKVKAAKAKAAKAKAAKVKAAKAKARSKSAGKARKTSKTAKQSRATAARKKK